MARSFEELMAAAQQGTPPEISTPTQAPKSFEELMSASHRQAGQGVRSFEELTGLESDPRGFVEGVVHDPLKFIPSLHAAKILSVADASKTLAKYGNDPEYYRRRAEFDLQGQAMSTGPFGKKVSVEERAEELRQADIKLVEDYVLEQEDKSRRGYTRGGKVGAIASEMLPFAVDFMTTGGIKTLGSEAAKKAATNSLRRYATTSFGKAAIATSGFAAGTTLRAAGMPHRAAEAIARRQVPRDIKISDDGAVDVTGPVEGPTEAIVKGLADHWITILSEESGEFLGPALKGSFGALGRKMPLFNRLIPRMEKAWLSKTGKSIAAFNKKLETVTGFHGMVGELGEEWLDNNLKAITTVEKYSDDPNATYLDQIVAANENFRDSLPDMILAFSIPGGIRTGLGLVNSTLEKKVAERNRIQQQLDMADSMEWSVPTQIDTAEGSLGYLPDLLGNMEESSGVVELKEPGIGKYFTPKWLVNRLIGAETLLEDVEAAHTAMSIERTDWQGWIGKVVKELRKEKDLTRLPEILEAEAEKEAAVDLQNLLGGEVEVERDPTFIPRGAIEKTKAHLLQKKITDMSPVAIMRDLLDTYEDAPSFLNENEARIFERVRALTRYMLDRVNRAREARGDNPITSVEGYITHWMDAAAEEEMEKRIESQSKKAKKLSKRVPNYTAEKRQIKNDLESKFSKDLGRLLQQMVKYDLRDIYITKPYQEALADLNGLDKLGVVRPETYRTIENYLRYDIREMETQIDRMFNKSMKKPADLLKRLSFGKVIIDDPARQVFGALRKLGFLSALGFRLKAPLRNLGQRMLLQDLYRTRDYLQAQAVAFRLAKMPQVEHPLTGEQVNLIDLIREQDWYKMTIQKFEDIVTPTATVRSRVGEVVQKTQDVGFHAYSRSHAGNLFLSNVEVSALTGYFDWKNNYEQSQRGTEHYKAARRYSVKHGIPLGQLLTQKEDMLWNIREAVRRTQWEYFATSMPTIFRGQVLRAGAQFKSWMMNYYFNHVREMGSQMLTGRNSRGRLLPGNGRLRALKGTGTIVAMGRMLESAFDIAVLKFLILPDISKPLSAPIPNFVLSLAAYLGADNDKDRKAAWKQLKNALRFWTPYSLAIKDLWELLSGEQDFSDLLFYKKKENKNG